MTPRMIPTIFLLVFSLWQWGSAFSASNAGTISDSCVQCHATKTSGFAAGHRFAASNCVSCHAGDGTASAEDKAHVELIAFPGDLGNAMRSCGGCHGDKVASVTGSLMHTGRGLVEVTRRLIDGRSGPHDTINFQSLGHGVADSLLRKQCASCHLGQSKTEHRHDVMRDRGGGCLACHINKYPDDAHPALTVNVSDARCFGCHSRSGRISLSYTGLAEVDTSTTSGETTRLRLPDGRPVERKPADVHYLAGMSCIDCHTGVGLMGAANDASHQGGAVDISCTDCHQVAEAVRDSTRILKTQKNHTPLTHIEQRADGVWLHTKNTGRLLKVPTLDPSHHAEDADHDRLECVTCHSQWAPQCFGCHMDYDPNGEQWDHIERIETDGRWTEQRSDVRNGLAALGVNERDRVDLFVPGMIMTVAHPDWDDTKFIRVFGALSPHTTGPSRSCVSCHRSSAALGLGQGEITDQHGEKHFRPVFERLQDTLPLDAWTNLGRSLGGLGPVEGQRPLTQGEMEVILDAPLE